ncbi:PspA/IM30 family protein [Rhodococcus sp. B50]|uniref:PspA/IM30 family protein n=1 Tax=Rhodococcus sp. B50 TaxID=2682847 RepID=UPI0019E18183|nr:hypothetical protein [Rhodococcus sp. B50]MBS9371875.1 hypothetical protein [Rhodococcus sp. B50]
MNKDEAGRMPSPEEPDRPEQPVPDVTPAGPETPTVPDVPPGPDIPDVPPIDPEPSPDPDVTPRDAANPHAVQVHDAEIVDPGVVDTGVVDSGVRAPTIEEITGYTADGVPTFESVREKIEQRSATALGAEELAHATGVGRTLDEQYEDRKAAAADRLAEIRRSMRSE